jgi:hypothetical protein
MTTTMGSGSRDRAVPSIGVHLIPVYSCRSIRVLHLKAEGYLALGFAGSAARPYVETTRSGYGQDVRRPTFGEEHDAAGT